MIAPRIVVSACLTGEKTRYNGEILQCEIIKYLLPYVEIIVVCPETSIGLPVPRNPINIINKKGEYRAIEENTNKDLTPDLLKFSSYFLQKLPPVDGFLLKSRSPSCGYSGTKVYADETKKVLLGRERGIFAKEICRVTPTTPIEDEERLSSFYIRHNYLMKIFILSNLRTIGKNSSIKRLFEYHKKIRPILSTYDPIRVKKLEKKVNSSTCFSKQWNIYFQGVKAILKHLPPVSSYFTILLKNYGPLIKKLDNVLYENLLKGIKRGRESELQRVIKKLRNLALEEIPSLQREKLLFPYPDELFEL